MAGTLLGVNTTLRVSNAIAVSQARTSSGQTTIYTCPASSYATINVFLVVDSSATGNSSATVDVGSQPVVYQQATNVINRVYISGITVGPSQVVRVNMALVSGSSTVTAYISGAEYINSP